MSASSYDEIPYESYPYPNSHPSRLATIAKLFGMTPMPIEACRVLELGCAAGGNLTPIAARCSKSQFLGIDFSPRQITDGKRVIEQLQLKNIELRCQDLSEISAKDGQFDYIICHGVWSWVPLPVRNRILEVCVERLSPNGVVFISYNTYPGWHLRGIVRDMMKFHCRKFPDPRERIANARGILDFITRMVPEENNAYGILLRNEVNLMRNKNNSYLAHEHLEENNHPVYFYEFAEQATASGLQYMGEAELRSMTAEGFGPEVSQVLPKIASTLIEYEQYLDFLRNRTFRQTLLCHKNISVDRNVDPSRISGLYLASDTVPVGEVQTAGDSEAKFKSFAGTLNTKAPLVKTALQILSAMWPRAIEFEILLKQVRAKLYTNAVMDPAQLQADARILAVNLLECFTRKYVDIYAADPACANAPGERPRASDLARLQAEHSTMAYNGLHQIVNLDELQRQVTRLADGTRTTNEIVDALVSKVQEGLLTVQQTGEPITNPAQIRPLLAEALTGALTFLARQGLLVGNQ